MIFLGRWGNYLFDYSPSVPELFIWIWLWRLRPRGYLIDNVQWHQIRKIHTNWSSGIAQTFDRATFCSQTCVRNAAQTTRYINFNEKFVFRLVFTFLTKWSHEMMAPTAVRCPRRSWALAAHGGHERSLPTAVTSARCPRRSQNWPRKNYIFDCDFRPTMAELFIWLWFF